jgi:hypothetical protein
VEDDFVAGLLKQYFVGSGNSFIFHKSITNGNSLQRSMQMPSTCSSPNPRIRSAFPKSSTKSASKAQIFRCFVLTSQGDRLPENTNPSRISFIDDGTLRVEFSLAYPAGENDAAPRTVLKQRFQAAESILILLQDDPDPDAIASGLALRQVLGRNKQTARSARTDA